MDKSILIFGAAKLQRSIIERAKDLGLYTIAIDPDPYAECRSIVDAYEVIGGDDYEATLAVAKKYNISGLVTAATDKPLVMMARISEALKLPFYSVKTAVMSTDKFLMKEAFIKGNIPYAEGKLVSSPENVSDFNYPLILKPRDNSGSRGVIYCDNISDLKTAFSETKQFTKKESILVEEYITGKEYSIESLHFNGHTKVIQYTEKITTQLPYNVELGHSQPANISLNTKEKINTIISKIGNVLGFTNCASHTELKINKKGIFVIETSPRLGGDYITSHLVPLSTGINMEDALIKIALGENIKFDSLPKASLISYLNFKIGREIISVVYENEMKQKFPEIVEFQMTIATGDQIKPITNSLNRYGHFILQGLNLNSLLRTKIEIENFLLKKLFSN